MSRLDFCKYELVDDCYDWKNDNCDECNIFKAYCEGGIRAKNSIVRCKDCKYLGIKDFVYGYCKKNMVGEIRPDDYCSYGERRRAKK